MREKLRAARKQAGMTQEEMANFLTISYVHYHKIEIGERVGAVDIWDALEDFTGIPQRQLRENTPNGADDKCEKISKPRGKRPG